MLVRSNTTIQGGNSLMWWSVPPAPVHTICLSERRSSVQVKTKAGASDAVLCNFTRESHEMPYCCPGERRSLAPALECNQKGMLEIHIVVEGWYMDPLSILKTLVGIQQHKWHKSCAQAASNIDRSYCSVPGYCTCRLYGEQTRPCIAYLPTTQVSAKPARKGDAAHEPP
jgi:hypothetical protein